jgi:hypothetical protein
MKTDRPILFTTEMVRAILEDRKSQTRRIIKPPFEIHANGYITRPNKYGRLNPYPCPYQVGQKLWVRETYADSDDFPCADDGVQYLYKADLPEDAGNMVGKWRPSIFMPREASRIDLLVKNICVERLQDISLADVIAEGVDIPNITRDEEYNANYRDLWILINGKGSWELNPWVWAIKFNRL